MKSHSFTQCKSMCMKGWWGGGGGVGVVGCILGHHYYDVTFFVEAKCVVFSNQDIMQLTGFN